MTISSSRHSGVRAAPAALGVFAHPDDEQFGTSGALLACADRGVNVHILSATRGDAGQISDPSLGTPETLGEVREGELREACRLLGWEEPILLDYNDGFLKDADPATLRDEIVVQIRRIRPRLVITFDANGAYGHTDHIAIHHATLAAVDAAADANHAPELGPAHHVDKLYFTAYPRSRFEALRADYERYGIPFNDLADVRTIPWEEVGTAAERVTTVVPVDQYWDRRLAGLFAHRTQFGENHPFHLLPEDDLRAKLGSDEFVRVRPAPIPGATLPDETDLWHGLPLDEPVSAIKTKEERV